MPLVKQGLDADLDEAAISAAAVNIEKHAGIGLRFLDLGMSETGVVCPDREGEPGDRLAGKAFLTEVPELADFVDREQVSSAFRPGADIDAQRVGEDPPTTAATESREALRAIDGPSCHGLSEAPDRRPVTRCSCFGANNGVLDGRSHDNHLPKDKDFGFIFVIHP